MAINFEGLEMSNGPVWKKVRSRGTDKASNYQWFPSEYEGSKLFSSLGTTQAISCFGGSDERLEVVTIDYAKKDGEIIQVVGFGAGLTEDFTFELWDCVAVRDTEYVKKGDTKLKIEVLP